MSVEIRVPQLGESIVEATISRWLKQEGQSVEADDPVVELETDKVNVEVPAGAEGVLSGIRAKEGETVSVGDLLGSIEPNGAGTRTADRPDVSPPSEGASREAPENDDREVLASPIARRLASENGIDLRLLAGTGPNGKITKEDVATYIEKSAEAPVTATARAREAVSPPKQSTAAGPATLPPHPPAARLDPKTSTAAAQPVASPPATVPSSPPSLAGEDSREERRPMSRRRRTIAARLVEAQRTAAMLTTFNEADMTRVIELRQKRREAFEKRHSVGLGFMSFFTKAVVGSLKAFPLLNAEIQGEEIVVKRHYDIGIAVSTDEGLVVPVVRDADRKSFPEIEREIAGLAARAREGRLTLPELMGGTFTITNGGIFGSLLSTPILNAPQVGILGMHKIQERPVVENGEVVVRPMMYLALSYDHRIVDGSEAVRFLVRIRELIEDPESLLLEG